MSTRTALTVVGGVVGAYFGYPQLGLVVGGLIGGVVDPQVIPGPKIGEIAAQSSADGIPRPIIYGTMACYGNVLQTGPAVKVEGDDGGGKGEPEQGTGDQVFRTYAIRIAEGEIPYLLRVWQDNKLVCDKRAGSQMVAESDNWLANKVFYSGSETQLPDPDLVSLNADSPSYRGTCYMVFISENLTARTGSIPQYRFEVSRSASSVVIGGAEPGAINSGGFFTDINVDDDGNVLMLRNQSGGSAPYGIGEPSVPGTWTISLYDKDDINSLLSSSVIVNAGDAFEMGADQRMGIIAIGQTGNYFSAGGEGTNAGNRLLSGGGAIAHLVDNLGVRVWGTESLLGTPIQYGGLVYMTHTHIYVGLSRSGYNQIHRWAITGGAPNLIPQFSLLDPVSTSGGMMYHMDRSGIIRVASFGTFTTIREYSATLNHLQDITPPGLAYMTPFMPNVYAFAMDDSKQLAVYLYRQTGTQVRAAVFNFAGTLIADKEVINGDGAFLTPTFRKILITEENIFIGMRNRIWRISASTLITPNKVILSSIIDDIHDRCSIDSSMYDTSELVDEVAGFMLAGDYTGADAIDSPKLVYFYDKSEHDKKLWYPKRGAAVIETLTVDDLTEVPDTTKREQAVEIPKKLHLKYQHAASGYPPVKATIASSSPDILTTGEATIEVPIVLDEDEAIQTADKIYKVTRAELYGQTEITVPLNVGARYVNGNCIGLALRGSIKRMRLTQMVLTPDWTIKFTLSPDRQSAYTSNLTGVPIPAPTLPPSTIIGDTEFAVLDIPARTDSEDDLNYYVAVSGALAPWYGARYQRSLDGGGSYSTVLDIRTASVMGELQNSLTDASEFFTDTTNTVEVTLYRESQSLDGISTEDFLSKGNPFALEKADGSWEVMQFQNAEENSDGSWSLTTLHRGQLNSGTSAHSAGARFVMLDRPSHITASSGWLNTDLTHRAISLGMSADDTTNEQTETYVGRSQTEWEPAYLELVRDGSDILTATWVRRGRFGSAFNPVLSSNYSTDRITFDDGTTSVSFDTTAGEYTYDASAMGPSVTVTVTPINRITGAGPASTGTV